MYKTSLDLPLDTKNRIDTIKGNRSFGYMVRVLLLKALDLPLYQDSFSIQQMEIQTQKLTLDIKLMRLEVEAREKELGEMLKTLEDLRNKPVPEPQKFNPHNLSEEQFQKQVDEYIADM